MTSEPAKSDVPQPVPVHPDLLAWARQTFDAEEFRRELERYRTHGGHSLASFIDEVRKQAIGS